MKRTTYYASTKKNKLKYIWIGAGILVVIAAIITALAYYSQNNNSNNDAIEPAHMDEGNEGQTKDPSGEEPVRETEPKAAEQPKETVEEVPKPEQQREPLNNGGYIEGQKLPDEPTVIEGILIANKKYPLPSDFAPGESEEARTAYEKMAADAKIAGFELVAFSTYRSFEYQETLYNNYVSRDGQESADRYSARPGYSEHQTGLAFDIGEKGKEDLWLTDEFGETEAGKWLADNAHKYGFILRYPRGKEHITGYMYESWHFRYLGVDIATKVANSNLTLEEYLGIE